MTGLHREEGRRNGESSLEEEGADDTPPRFCLSQEQTQSKYVRGREMSPPSLKELPSYSQPARAEPGDPHDLVHLSRNQDPMREMPTSA